MKRWMLMFLLLLFCSISIVKAEETPSLDLSQYEGKTGRFDTDPEEVAVHTEAGTEMIFAQAHIGMDSSLYYGGYCAAGQGDWDGDGNYFNDVYFNNIQGSPMNERRCGPILPVWRSIAIYGYIMRRFRGVPGGLQEIMVPGRLCRSGIITHCVGFMRRRVQRH